MVTLSTRTERTGGVTLVGCRLANDADEPRVAVVASRLDAPTRVPAANRSDEGTLRATVPAGATVGVGFATPAPPAEPAAELIADRPAEGRAPEGVVAGLSDPRPPRAALLEDDSTDEVRDRTDDAATTAELDAAERRIERLAAVAAATTVPGAAAELESVGGLERLRELDATVRADRNRLLALADRAERLAARAEAVDPHLDALERLS